MNTPKNANLFMFILLMFVGFIILGVFSILNMIFPILATPEYTWVLQVISSVFNFFVPILIFMLIKKIKFTDIVPVKKVSLKNIIFIVILSFLVQPIPELIGNITNVFFQDKVSETLNSFATLSYPISILVIGIAPAIFEELAFRGAILTGFRKSGFWIGIFISSLYFGMIHLTITQLFYTFVSGIFFAFLVKCTGSILSSILAHFIINSTQITYTYLIQKIIPNVEITYSKLTLADIIPSVWKVIISLPFLAFFIYLFIKNNKEYIKEEKSIPKTESKVFGILFFINIITYIVIMQIIK